MSQDWNVPPTGLTVFGTWVKTDVANALQTLRSMYSGTAAPTSTVAYMEYADTTLGLRRQRNSGDTNWDTIAPLNTDLGRDTILVPIGTLSATTTIRLFAPQLKTCKILSAHLLSDTASTGSDATNNWAFQLRNVTDSLDLLATPKNTNGAEIAVDTPYDIVADQNQTLDPDDVLHLIATKNGAATTLTTVQLQLEVTYSI